MGASPECSGAAEQGAELDPPALTHWGQAGLVTRCDLLSWGRQRGTHRSHAITTLGACKTILDESLSNLSLAVARGGLQMSKGPLQPELSWDALIPFPLFRAVLAACCKPSPSFKGLAHCRRLLVFDLPKCRLRPCLLLILSFRS